MILNKLEIIKYFDIIVSGDEVQNSKPSPDIFLLAAKLLCAMPNECLVIEDSENGVKAAKLAGMKCVGFKNPNSGNQDLTLSDTVVCSISEIDFRSY